MQQQEMRDLQMRHQYENVNTFVEYVTLQNNNNNKDIHMKEFVLLIVSQYLIDEWPNLTAEWLTPHSAVLRWQLCRQSVAACLLALASVSGMWQARRQATAEKLTNDKIPLVTKSAGPAYAVPHDPLFKSLQQQQASQLEYLQRSWSSPRQTEFRPQTTAGFFKVSLKWKNTSNSLIFPP